MSSQYDKFDWVKEKDGETTELRLLFTPSDTLRTAETFAGAINRSTFEPPELLLYL